MEQKIIEDILNKYVIESPSMGRSVILADRIDEVAEDIRQHLLQQTLRINIANVNTLHLERT